MASGPNFAHGSEAELARILDFYQVHWEYEPRTFPILWNLEGAVVESFSPDFYLPELDLYLELTTLKQSLVRKKNRKLRRLRELYPDLRIKLFYGKDFKALLVKYGRIDVAASLTGLEGQARARRAAPGPSVSRGCGCGTPARSRSASPRCSPRNRPSGSSRSGRRSRARRVRRGSRRRRNRRLAASLPARPA